MPVPRDLTPDQVAHPLISLDVGDPHLGLLILVPSGVSYVMQTGGTFNLHASAEGVYLPLGSPEQADALAALFDGEPTVRLDASYVAPINTILAAERETSMLAVDESRLAQSREAWVHVSIGPHPHRHPSYPLIANAQTVADPDSPINQAAFPFFGFSGARGVLVWPNSD